MLVARKKILSQEKIGLSPTSRKDFLGIRKHISLTIAEVFYLLSYSDKASVPSHPKKA